MIGAKRGLAPDTYDSWLASVKDLGTGITAGPLLAWAPTADGGVCIASRGLWSLLIVAGGAAADGSSTGSSPDAWQHLGWHQIARGNFSAEDLRLSWTTYQDGPGEVMVPEPGRVPEVFRERVAASIAVEEFIPFSDSDERGVIVSGRRDLSQPDAAIAWHASLPSGVTTETPDIEDLAAAAVDRLRAEYDPLA